MKKFLFIILIFFPLISLANNIPHEVRKYEKDYNVTCTKDVARCQLVICDNNETCSICYIPYRCSDGRTLTIIEYIGKGKCCRK